MTSNPESSSAAPPLRVAIIGGGGGGVAALKHALDMGMDATLFERGKLLGGVWANYAYHGVTAQSPRRVYRFMELAMEKDMNADAPYGFAPAHTIREYIAEYATTFNLNSHIHLSTEVEQVEELSDASLRLRLRHCNSTNNANNNDENKNLRTEQVFDKVVIATGLFERPRDIFFSDERHVPLTAVTEEDMRSMEEENEAVAIIGHGKTAVDMANQMADRGIKVNIYSRTHRNMMPEPFLGTHVEDIFFNYEAASWTPQNPQGVVSYKGVPERSEEEKKAHFAGIEKLLKEHYYKDKYAPSTPSLIDDLNLKTFVIEERYFTKHLQNGTVREILVVQIGTDSSGRVEVDGQPLKEKRIFSALGFETRTFPFLSPSSGLRCVLENKHLYHSMVHPQHPNVLDLTRAANSSFCCLLSAELSAMWGLRFLIGDITVSQEDYENERKAFSEHYGSETNLENFWARAPAGNFLAFHDMLLKEMGFAQPEVEPKACVTAEHVRQVCFPDA